MNNWINQNCNVADIYKSNYIQAQRKRILAEVGNSRPEGKDDVKLIKKI